MWHQWKLLAGWILLKHVIESLAAKSIAITSVCILVWLTYTPSMGMGTYMREWNLSLWRNEWHCTLLSMDPRLISIDPIAKSMTDTKYKQECLKLGIKGWYRSQGLLSKPIGNIHKSWVTPSDLTSVSSASKSDFLTSSLVISGQCNFRCSREERMKASSRCLKTKTLG